MTRAKMIDERLADCIDDPEQDIRPDQRAMYARTCRRLAELRGAVSGLLYRLRHITTTLTPKDWACLEGMLERSEEAA